MLETSNIDRMLAAPTAVRATGCPCVLIDTPRLLPGEAPQPSAASSVAAVGGVEHCLSNVIVHDKRGGQRTTNTLLL